MDLIKTDIQQIITGSSGSDHSLDIRCSGFKFARRVLQFIGAFLLKPCIHIAAHEDRLHRFKQIIAPVQDSNTVRSAHLVSGKRHQVDPDIPYVNMHMRYCLSAVRNENRTVFMGHLADSSHVRHVAGQVGGVGTDHQPGAGADQPLQLPVVQPAEYFRAHSSQAPPQQL